MHAQQNKEAIDSTLASNVADGAFSWKFETFTPNVRVRLTPRDTSSQKKVVRVDSALQFFEAIRTYVPAHQFITVAGTLAVGFQQAYVSDYTIYDSAEQYGEWAEESEHKDCSPTFEKRHHPMSLVGTIFSYEMKEVYEPCSAVGDSHRSIETFDLKTRKPALLTRWISEASLVKALKKDPWVRKKYRDYSYRSYVEKLDSSQTVVQIEEALAEYRELNFGGRKFDISLGSFHFADYNSECNLVAVRLAAFIPKPYHSPQMIQIGLWVKPKPELRHALMQVTTEGKGFFSEDLANKK